jgi:hypothetical protein
MMQMLRKMSKLVAFAILLVFASGGAMEVFADTIKIKASAKGPAYDLQQAAKRGEIPESLLKVDGKSADPKDYTGSLTNANGAKVTPQTAREQPKGEYTLDTETATRDPFLGFVKGEIAHYGPVKWRKSNNRQMAKPVDSDQRSTAPIPVVNPLRGKWPTTAVGGRVTVFPSLGAVRQPGETANYAITAKNSKGEEVTDLKLGEVKGNQSSIRESGYEAGIITLTAGNPGTATIQVMSESDPTLSFAPTLVVTHPEIETLTSDVQSGEIGFVLGGEPVKVTFKAITPNSTEIETPLAFTGYDPKVVKVTREGMVLTIQPLAVGTTTVTVSPQAVQGDRKPIKVSVAEKAVQKTALDKTELLLEPGQMSSLVAAVHYTDQTTSQKLTEPVPSKPEVATARLEDGKVVVTAVGPGDTDITIGSAENPHAQVAVVKVKVSKPKPPQNDPPSPAESSAGTTPKAKPPQSDPPSVPTDADSSESWVTTWITSPIWAGIGWFMGLPWLEILLVLGLIAFVALVVWLVRRQSRVNNPTVVPAVTFVSAFLLGFAWSFNVLHGMV